MIKQKANIYGVQDYTASGAEGTLKHRIKIAYTR
jgi:hypothetical protein